MDEKKLIEKLESSEHYNVRDKAAKMLADHYIQKGEWSGIEKLLEHRDDLIKWHAAKALAEAVRNRMDTPILSSLGKVLGKAISEDDDDMVFRLAETLAYYYINKKEWDKVEKLLEHKENFVRGGTALAFVCHHIEKRGWGDAEKLLKHKNSDIRMHAASELACYYLDKGKWNKIDDLLKHEDEWVRRDAAYTVEDSPHKIPERWVKLKIKTIFLVKEIDDIYFPLWKKKEILGTERISAILMEFLCDKDEKVRRNAVIMLKEVVEQCDVVEKLDEIQKAFENYFTEWLKKQPSGRTREKVEMELKMSKLLMDISKKKAHLSKKDGELLLGETVKKPKDSNKKIYRNLRRVSRNG
jgi:HEAT repeat protein